MLDLDSDIPLRYKIIAIIILVIAFIAFPTFTGETSAPFNKLVCPEWDCGAMKANVTIKTEISIKEKDLKPVHYYGNGSCVPYARYRTGIGITGWAKYALTLAAELGYATGTEPVKGSMMVTSEGGGHVAAVEEILPGGILISEQNWKGLFIVSERIVPFNHEPIMGFIYDI